MGILVDIQREINKVKMKQAKKLSYRLNLGFINEDKAKKIRYTISRINEEIYSNNPKIARFTVRDIGDMLGMTGGFLEWHGPDLVYEFLNGKEFEEEKIGYYHPLQDYCKGKLDRTIAFEKYDKIHSLNSNEIPK